MTESNISESRAVRKTTRQRVSRKIAEEKSVIVFNLPSKEEIFDDTFKFSIKVQKNLYDKNYRMYIAPGNGGSVGNYTLPRYFAHHYYKNNRSSHEYNYSLQNIKSELDGMGFKSTGLNPYLYKHQDLSALYVFVKRYAQANTVGIFLMRYYNQHKPTMLDLL